MGTSEVTAGGPIAISQRGISTEDLRFYWKHLRQKAALHCRRETGRTRVSQAASSVPNVASGTHSGSVSRQLPSPLRGYVPFASCDTELRAPLPLSRQGRSATIVGRHRITIEHIPEDMNWLELKDLGAAFGSSVTFSRTYRRGSSSFGMLEYSDPRDARRCAEELDGRRMEDGKAPMR